METAIRNAAPLNLAKAQELASTMSVSYRSVIAKAKQLGVEYVSKAPAAKREGIARKADYVNAIQIFTGLSLEGLDKAPLDTLVKLSDFLATKAS